MTAVSHRSPTTPAAVAAVQPLRHSDVPRLQLDWRHRLGDDDARHLLETYPERSVWMPDSREFGIVGPWRHRAELAAIQELAAVRHAGTIIAGLADQCRAAGVAALLALELDEVRPPAFYLRHRFDVLEEVVAFQLMTPSPGYRRGRGLEFRRAALTDAAAMRTLLEIDHAAFPWLWRNSAAEFAAYGELPGVELWTAWFDGRAVGYLGITNYLGWGHLDRIAVLPAYQGRSLGRHLLGYAIDRLARLGAGRIGLSTQADNLRSRRLYERAGFRRWPEQDYRLYGMMLRGLTATSAAVREQTHHR